MSVIDESGDSQTGTVTATIPVGSYYPFWMALDPANHNVYVTNGTVGTVSVISPEVSPTITGTPSAAVVGTAYSYQFAVTGIPTPMESITAGALAPGMTLSSTGTLSGVPTTSGTYTFTVTAHNALAPTRRRWST